MAKINWFRALLLLVIGLASSTNAQFIRPDEVPVSILREGCYPFIQKQCPAKYFCYVDFAYKKWGQCACRTGYTLRQLPPTPTEPGSDIAKLPHADDCVPIGFLSVPVILTYYFILAAHAIMLVGSIIVLKSVIQKGGFKLNSSCIALIGLIGASVGAIIRNLAYTLGRMNWDRDGAIFDLFFPLGDAIENVFNILTSLESCCTWFDLWQKSVSMSKRSTRLVNAMFVTLRTYGLLFSSSFFAANMGWFPGVTVGSPFYNRMNDWNQSLIVFCCGVGAPLLSRLLCKDMKDVKNPNWKAASAIRLTGCYAALTSIGFNLSYRFFIKTGIYTAQARFMNQTSFLNLSLLTVVYFWAWYQYLQFAHRRYMAEDPTSRLSQYFGFTTIGLKGSRASVVSGKSSTTSSAASSASVASTSSVAASSSVETEGTDGKGTMA